jgi:hypothetical protein
MKDRILRGGLSNAEMDQADERMAENEKLISNLQSRLKAKR